jgi:hypothetical protein
MSEFQQIHIFNNMLDNFLNYLEDTFPYLESDIFLAKNSIVFIRKGNPRLIVEQFKDTILPYSKQINDYDEDFFLNFENNIQLDKENFLFGLKLKKMFLDNENPNESKRQKATIFYYLSNLIKISHRI